MALQGGLMIEDIDADFFFVQRGWLNGNHFVLRAPETILIDAAYKSGLEETMGILDRLGVAPASVERIILTHAHCDHVGAVAAVQRASNCQVALHAVSFDHLTHRNDWATWWRYYDQEADFFEVHEALVDGQIIHLGRLRFQVIHAPGHAGGQICLFEADRKLLISADAFWEGDVGTFTPRIEGLDCAHRALATLKRLEALGAKKVYPGHGPPFENVAEAFQRAKAKVSRLIQEPKLLGRDQVKKILVWTLLMKGGLTAPALFDHFSKTPWFGETMSLFFAARRPRLVFDGVVAELLAKGVVRAEGSFLRATVAA